ncbi:MAG: chemotaxis protein CheW [Nitrospiria bacterium]
MSGLAKETEKAPTGESGSLIEALTFCLDGESYAIETVSVQEITKIFETTFVPGTPSFVKGIVPIRGKVMPVFDLHERLGLSPFLKGRNSRFVICQVEEGSFAFMVDQVLDVVQFIGSQLKRPSPGGFFNESGYVKGIVGRKGRLFILVDFEKISRLN